MTKFGYIKNEIRVISMNADGTFTILWNFIGLILFLLTISVTIWGLIDAGKRTLVTKIPLEPRYPKTKKIKADKITLQPQEFLISKNETIEKSGAAESRYMN